MKTTLRTTPIEGVFLVEIDHVKDARGFFIETWNQRDFASAGLDVSFVQHNHSSSRRQVLRGLHYQDRTAPVGKLVRCTAGRIFDVAVDLRAASPTFGHWYGVELNAGDKRQIWVPSGCAHGFATLSDIAEVQYSQTGFYAPAAEGGIRWNDPEIGIDWPVTDPILSSRDASQPSFADYRSNPEF